MLIMRLTVNNTFYQKKHIFLYSEFQKICSFMGNGPGTALIDDNSFFFKTS